MLRSFSRVRLYLICFAAGHEIIRQRIEGLIGIRLTPDLVYDQMIEAHCFKKLVFSWAGNPGVGSLHALRRKTEAGSKEKLETERRALIKQALEAQGFVGSVQQKVRTAIDISDSLGMTTGDDDAAWAVESAQMLEEKQELVSLLIVYIQQGWQPFYSSLNLYYVYICLIRSKRPRRRRLSRRGRRLLRFFSRPHPFTLSLFLSLSLSLSLFLSHQSSIFLVSLPPSRQISL